MGVEMNEEAIDKALNDLVTSLHKLGATFATTDSTLRDLAGDIGTKLGIDLFQLRNQWILHENVWYGPWGERE